MLQLAVPLSNTACPQAIPGKVWQHALWEGLLGGPTYSLGSLRLHAGRSPTTLTVLFGSRTSRLWSTYIGTTVSPISSSPCTCTPHKRASTQKVPRKRQQPMQKDIHTPKPKFLVLKCKLTPGCPNNKAALCYHTSLRLLSCTGSSWSMPSNLHERAANHCAHLQT